MNTRVYQTTVVGPDAHHDALLSNLAVEAFATDEDTFIGDQLFPSVPVAKRSDRYAILDKAAFLRIIDPLRAEKTEARRVEFKVSSDAYFADNYALAGEIALEDLANVDMAFRLRENETRLVVTNLRRAQENRIVNIVTTAANLGSGTSLTGTDKWNDYVNSDPIGDVNTAHAFIQQNTGLIANTMAIDWDTMKILRRHPDLLDMYKFTVGGQITNDQLRAVFDIDKILVSRAINENALEGGATSMTSMWGNNALVAHIMAGTSLRTRTLGLRFQWRPSGFPAPFSVSRKREEGAGTRWVEVIEANHFQDEKIIASELGYLIAGTL